MAADPEIYLNVLQGVPEGSSKQNLQQLLGRLCEQSRDLCLGPTYVRDKMVDTARSYQSHNGSALIVETEGGRNDIAALSQRLSGEGFERLAFKRILEDGLPEGTVLLPPEAVEELTNAMHPEREVRVDDFDRAHVGKYAPDFIAAQKGEDGKWRIVGLYEVTMSNDARHHVALPHIVKVIKAEYPKLFVETPAFTLIIPQKGNLSYAGKQLGDTMSGWDMQYLPVDIDTHWAHEQAIGVIRQVYVEDLLKVRRKIPKAIQNRSAIDAHDNQYNANSLARRLRTRGI